MHGNLGQHALSPVAMALGGVGNRYRRAMLDLVPTGQNGKHGQHVLSVVVKENRNVLEDA